MELERQANDGQGIRPVRVRQGESADRHCVGCPGLARGLLEGMLGESTATCAFDSIALEAREEIPAAWSEKYAFAFVRRGYLVRQHVDPAGHLTAIDAVGPGCAFPLLDKNQPSTGYAVSRALVCLCTLDSLERAIGEGGSTAVDLHRLLREAFGRVERLAHARGRSSAASKVAGLLCALSETLQPERPDLPIPADFLQRDLAALLSIRHESVCRVLRGFNDEGLTERSGDSLRLLQPASLQRR